MNLRNRSAHAERPDRRIVIGHERPAGRDDRPADHGLMQRPITAVPRTNRSPWTLSGGPVVFWLLATVILLNVNNISNMTFGFGWPITVIVALCSLLVCLVSRLSAIAVLGLPGIALVTSLALYGAIGAGAALLRGEGGAELVGTALQYRPWLAILTAVAAALGIGAELQRSGFDQVVKTILVIHVVICALILLSPLMVQYLYAAMKENVLWSAEFRAFGPFANPNNAGIAACQSAAIALTALAGRTHRKLAGLLLPLALAATVASFSRAAWLTLAAVLAAAFYWQMARGGGGERAKAAAIWTAAVLLTAIGVSVAIQFDLLIQSERQIERIVSLFRMGQMGESASPRLALWLEGLFRIAEAPLFGHGIGAFHSFEGALPHCWNGSREAPCGVHNAYLLFWGEAGAIPAAILCLFVACFLWRSAWLRRSVPMNAACGFVLVFAIACLFSSGLPYTVWNAFVLGIACALATYAERRTRRTPVRVPTSKPMSAASGAHRASSPKAQAR